MTTEIASNHILCVLQGLANAELSGLISTILPAIQNEYPFIRQVGVHCLGLYCLLGQVKIV